MSNEPAVTTAPAAESHAPLADDEWEQDRDELPPRPRRRLLGVGANPTPIALLGVLLTACGFIGGVLVEKGQTSSPTTSGAAAGLASRFAALRGGAAGGGARGTGGAGAAAAGGGFAGRFGGAGAAGGATIGEVAYLSGSTLYVTDAEGNTVKVTTSPASSITKTVKTDIHGINPGDTIVVRGAKSASGAVSAESVSVETAGGGGGGLGALLGGGGGAGAGSSGRSESGLFGG
jgi:hypothetical protein